MPFSFSCSFFRPDAWTPSPECLCFYARRSSGMCFFGSRHPEQTFSESRHPGLFLSVPHFSGFSHPGMYFSGFHLPDTMLLKCPLSGYYFFSNQRNLSPDAFSPARKPDVLTVSCVFPAPPASYRPVFSFSVHLTFLLTISSLHFFRSSCVTGIFFPAAGPFTGHKAISIPDSHLQE